MREGLNGWWTIGLFLLTIAAVIAFFWLSTKPVEDICWQPNMVHVECVNDHPADRQVPDGNGGDQLP